MNPSNDMPLLLVLILGSLSIILFRYRAQLALRLLSLRSRNQLTAQIPTTRTRAAGNLPIVPLDTAGVGYAYPPVIRRLAFHEGGLPYASRSS